jgi:hypothetical protein
MHRNRNSVYPRAPPWRELHSPPFELRKLQKTQERLAPLPCPLEPRHRVSHFARSPQTFDTSGFFRAPCRF